MREIKKIIMSLGLLLWFSCTSLIPLKVGPPSDIKIERTSARLSRGKYLMDNVVHCLYCHSKFDERYYSFPPAPRSEGIGGAAFEEDFGIVYGANITPSALGDWSDGEVIQAITEGVNKKGESLFPIMSYPQLRFMSTEDVYSVVSYLRTLEPISNKVSAKKLKFPLGYIERTFPKPWTPQPQPDPANKVAYGKYLATIANCIMCHTPTDKMGKPLPGMYLAGGQRFRFQGGEVFSTNLTPDLESGIGNRSQQEFIDLFRSFKDPIVVPPDKKSENTVMPWMAFAGMTDEDLGAIFAFLRSVKSVKNVVEKWPAKEG